jgi:hypothetical protein
MIVDYITRKQAKDILNAHHYITKSTNKFRNGIFIGCFEVIEGFSVLTGVAVFSNLSVKELSIGMFGTTEQNGMYELSRFCLSDFYEQRRNKASQFLSKAIKLLRSGTNVRCILSYADSDVHVGTIYQATNFIYYGTTTPKKDFFFLEQDGSFKKHVRGTVKGLQGEWRPVSYTHLRAHETM